MLSVFERECTPSFFNPKIILGCYFGFRALKFPEIDFNIAFIDFFLIFHI